MKTILYIYHTSTIGGGSYCLLNILKAIDRTKYCPSVLLKEEGPLVDEISKLGIKVFLLSKIRTVPYNVSTITPKNIWNAFNIIASISSYEKLLQEIRPDIVYVNTMMLYPYLRSAKKYGARTIIHIREHWPEGEHVWQRKIALQHIDKYADHIVGINSYSISMFDFSQKPKTVVYDWIDMKNRYEERPLSAIFGENMDNKKVFLYMGGMQPIKGGKQIITTFSAKIDDPNARLLVMGINTTVFRNGWKANLKRILTHFGYESYTETVLDAIKNDKRIKCIPSTYMINHIVQQAYCVLSYFTIPHANLALAESIILGTPSIAVDTPESREYSSNGKMALLFPINDINGFENAIAEFKYRRENILNNIQRNSHLIKDMFSPESNIKKLHELFDYITR